MHHKIKVITGKEESGKSFLARNLALGYDNPVLLSGREDLKDPFFFDSVNETTDLIIIDDVPSVLVNELIIDSYGTIVIHKRGQCAKEILSPRIIITTTNYPTKNHRGSLARRVDLIETNIEKLDNGRLLFNANLITKN